MHPHNILLLDVDNTIVIAKDNYIYKIINGKEIALTPAEFAQEDIHNNRYDFRDFEDPDRIKSAIMHGQPIVYVLDFMRDKLDNGWEVGILTARPRGKLIKKILRTWLFCRDEEGKWTQIGDKLKRVFAIGEVGGTCSSNVEKKIAVLKRMCKEYEHVMFIDDDQSNIEAARQLKLDNLIAINTNDLKFIVR